MNKEEKQVTNNNYSNNSNTILKVIVVILVLFLCLLTSYKVLIYDKKDNKPVNDNNIENNDKKDYSSFGSVEDINKSITVFSYAQLTNTDKTYEELYRTFILWNSKKAVSKSDIKNYNTLNGLPKTGLELAKGFDLTDEEISKIDETLWKQAIGNNSNQTMIDGSVIKSKVKELYGDYGNMFDKSFVANMSDLGWLQNTNEQFNSIMIYDANVDKLVIDGSSGETKIKYTTQILSSNIYNDIYNIRFIEAFVDDTSIKKGDFKKPEDLDKKYSCSLEEISINDCISTSRDELNQYDITFKKINNNWYFDSIKKLNDDEKLMIYGTSDNSFKKIDIYSLGLYSDLPESDVYYEKNIDKFKLKYKCVPFNGMECAMRELTIDDKMKFTITSSMGCSSSYDISYNDNYIVVQETNGCGTPAPLKIYDSAWNLKFEFEYVRHSYIKNNVLYYTVIDKEYYESCKYSVGEYEFTSIDFNNNMKTKTIFKFKNQLIGSIC